MLKKLKQSNNRGFTIIEVMIVLAIAGLILLIVFLAVPALERSSRNNGRKNDAARIVSSVSEYVSDSNGQQPTGTNGAAATIVGDAGNLSQFSGITGNTTATPAQNELTVATFSAMPPTPTSLTNEELVVYTGASCSGGNAVSSTITNSAALIYPIEQGNNTYVWTCDDAE